ncbi:DUF6745 domain-containing protein [Nocardiopsis suaedae]|uniref:DUF6745 domain-containing protein n=1 Tax=Nocardiopsis suaedae TaxID=3018444 RepID=A0ABT4TKS5_9ACTN|nr:hypothetical protein [Nocardiopsis suaedae]MDA2805289.1 hypothetical protein [Nocardiopsis suaedae]
MTGRRGAENPDTESLSLLRRAAAIRDEWLAHGLSTEPADRPAAEAAISALYRLVDRPPPRFVWADSPGSALYPGSPLRRAEPTLAYLNAPDAVKGADPPVHVRLADLWSGMRSRLDRAVALRLRTPQGAPRPPATLPAVPPERALRDGVGIGAMIDVTVRHSLTVSLRDAVRAPLLTEFAACSPRPLADAFRGQHDAFQVGPYDAWNRLGLASYPAWAQGLLDLWSATARSCGWWWPGEEVCVVAERTAALHSEPMPDAVHGEVRLHHDGGPAVLYRDGWGAHVLNGARVPAWVLTNPTPERIAAEANVEVRRAAIERIGWDAYIDAAGLSLVAAAPDPGNPGSELRLYDMPESPVAVPGARTGPGPTGRVLVVVNGSLERDGTRRRYGLPVPGSLDDPVDAAGWTYGLSRDVYARLARRT